MMDTDATVHRGIFGLPNEILLNIFSSFATPELLRFSPTCRQIHSLVLRLLHHRLLIAAGLDGHSLYLECGPPAAKWTISKDFCSSLGTDGLQDLANDIYDSHKGIGQVERMNNLYSRFRPVSKEPDHKARTRPHPAGDIPGSRTWIAPDSSEDTATREDDAVRRIVSIDAQCLFSQLETVAFLGRRGSMHGLLFSVGVVCDGTIRVWRDWLSRQCERKRWSDGAPIVIHHDDHTNHSGDSRVRADKKASSTDYTKDPSILWINTRKEDVGIKFRVKEQKWRRDNPVLFATDVEVPVSYSVELEEVVIRTTHLLLKLEEAQREIENQNGKAIVFGSYIGSIS